MNRKETEAYVIGFFLLKESLIHTFPIKPEYFMHEPYRIIMENMLEIYKCNPAEFKLTTLINLLEIKGLLGKVGGLPEIVGLQINLPNEPTNAYLYSAINLIKNAKSDFVFNIPI